MRRQLHSLLDHKGLSLERLLLLCDIAHFGGIKAAVGTDPVRQSLASRQLKELCAYVGTPLCKRKGKSLDMTSEGKELALIAERFFSEFYQFLLKARSRPEQFLLGIGDSIFQWHLLPKMYSFSKLYPNVQLIPFSYTAAEISAKVETQELDAGIVRLSAATRNTLLTQIPIGSIKYKLFIPSSFARGNDTRNFELKDLPCCTLIGDGAYAQALENLLSAYNGKPVLNCSSMTQMFAAVQSGHYAAILPESAAKSFSAKSTTAMSLPELAAFTREIVLIYRNKNLSETKLGVLKFLSQSI